MENKNFAMTLLPNTALYTILVKSCLAVQYLMTYRQNENTGWGTQKLKYLSIIQMKSRVYIYEKVIRKQ